MKCFVKLDSSEFARLFEQNLTLPLKVLNEISYKSRSDPDSKQKTETELTFWYVLPYFVHSGTFQTKQKEKQGCTSHI